LNTTLSIIFLLTAPMRNTWPVGLAYFPPEDRTCQPMSKEARIWWQGSGKCNINWSTLLFSKFKVDNTSSCVAFSCVLHFTASTVGYVKLSRTENCGGHLWESGKSRNYVRMEACSPPTPICCNAELNRRLMSYWHRSLLVPLPFLAEQTIHVCQSNCCR